MRTYTYRLHHDLGFAPNPFFGWCSLACCMVGIREHARINDIIVGIAGTSSDGLKRLHPQLIYWLQVDEAMTFDQYWEDPRFSKKKPAIPGPKIRMVGDNTYRHDPVTGKWVFDLSMHFIPNSPQTNRRHVDTDTKIDRILLSRRFTYWGKSGPLVPEALLGLFPKRRGYKRHHRDPSLVNKLHELIDLENPRSVIDEPADWGNQRYFTDGCKV